MNFDHTMLFYINESYIRLKCMTNFSPCKTGLVTRASVSIQGSKEDTKLVFHRIHWLRHNANQVIISYLKLSKTAANPFHNSKHILEYPHLLHCFSYSQLNSFLPSVSLKKINCSSQIKTKCKYQYHQLQKLQACFLQEQHRPTYSRTTKSTISHKWI